ncbi:MAG: FecR domain-containing protein [Kiloniellales bacterium]
MSYFVGKAGSLIPALALTFALLGLGAPAKALDEGPWLVAEVQGDAWLKAPDGGKTPLQQGAEIAPGSVVGASDGGRATLSRGGTAMTLSPASETEIPPDSDQGSRTTIFQRLGTLLLKVDKRPEQHFEVDTPFLAAVVKGTTFTVSVDGAGSAVHVVEGAVEVGSLATGEVALVRPGQTARVSSQPGSGLKLSGIGAPSGQSGGNQQQGQNAASSGADQAAAGQSADGTVAPQGTKGQAGTSGTNAGQHTGLARGLTIEQPIGWNSIDIAAVSNGFVAVVPDAAVSGVKAAVNAGGKPAVASASTNAVTIGTVNTGNAASGVAAAGNAVFGQAGGAGVGSVVSGTASATGAAASGAATAATGAVAATGGTVGTVVQNTVAAVQNQTQNVGSAVNSLLGGGKNGKGKGNN